MEEVQPYKKSQEAPVFSQEGLSTDPSSQGITPPSQGSELFDPSLPGADPASGSLLFDCSSQGSELFNPFHPGADPAEGGLLFDCSSQGSELFDPFHLGADPAEGGLSSGEELLLYAGEEIPRYHKRAFAHNYYAPFIYHIILKKTQGCVIFGAVKGDARIAPGNPGCAYIEESLLGGIIAKAILDLQKQFPILKIYQFKVMPDHVHILLRVMDWSDYHLDYYIETLVSNIASRFSQAKGEEINWDTIFLPGYCDKPLLLKRSLDCLYNYIRVNPHRLAMRQQFPQFFQRVRKLKIGEKEYEAYGNLFLFRNPDKEAVKISRRFTPVEVEEKKAAWLSEASKGTILVSPFISRKEKEIRSEAESLGAKIILIIHEEFGERYKPAAHDFELCSNGRLLIISLGMQHKTALTRDICIRMNNLAQTISCN